ncbi:hypothetical protein EYZ11_009656 [Aspergillus tanneri]|uniref:CN hydrolase domain-containing protein n=1 Tax=Aspergillus tanneri TaxID=1220188 RepID=A0A4S3J7C1_9EURO|nr:uncharacterized protein ATNIH1004_009683 [Aspergillus tanneri]KAA8642922.1 hypothetical protein ATNIH1004_009683 [Aspergillus tanneri]THC90876.1 hypothetical protein EYZ11_009656 [Aspergillus tanneri]
MAPIKRVAVIQWHIKDLEIEQNHHKACQYIRDAASQGAEIAVLPEYHLNGFAPTSSQYTQQAESAPSYLKAYQTLARDLNICLVPGTIVEKHGANLFNTAYFISNDGQILGSYRKKNIWHPERPFLTSSDAESHEVLATPIGKVGLLICWDLAFPEAFRELIVKGAEVIIVPTFWTRHDASPESLSHNPECETLLLESMLTTRCFENTCGIIFANASGPDDQDKFLGLSRVVLPIVGSVGQMGCEEGVLVVDMDLGLVRIAEENYKIRQDIKSEGWHYGSRG